MLLSLNVERTNLATSSSSQFHCCWRIFTLIKYSSLLGLENARLKCIENLRSKNMEVNVAKLTLHLINVAEIDVYGN